MKKAERLEYLREILLSQEKENEKYRLNIKFYKKVVFPQLKIDHKKKEIGKLEMDSEKNKIPVWEKAIVMNEKFGDIIKEKIKRLEESLK